MKQKILKPKNDIAYQNTLKNLKSETDKEQFIIFIHYLVVQILKKNKKTITTYGVEIPTKFLNKNYELLHHTYNYLNIRFVFVNW